MRATKESLASICLIFFINGVISTEKVIRNVDFNLLGKFLHQYCLLRNQSKVLIYGDLKTGWWSTELSDRWLHLGRYLSRNGISTTVIDLSSYGNHKLPPMAMPPGGFGTLMTAMYDGSSTPVGALLKRSSDLRLFRSRYNWLILTPLNKRNYLEELFQQIGIYTDSNVHYGVIYNTQSVKIWEAYHVALDKPLRRTYVGNWSPIDLKNTSTTPQGVMDKADHHNQSSRIWKLSTEPLKYKYVKRSNLEGIRLRAITVGIRPYMTDFRRNSKGILEITGGFFGEVFKTIKESINFTYTLKYTPGYSYGKIKELGNNWTGVVGYLVSKRADIALCGISESKWRSSVIDLTTPLLFQRSRLFVNSSPSPYQFNLYFRPFTVQLWAFLIISFFLIALFRGILRLVYATVKGKKQSYIPSATQHTKKKKENTILGRNRDYHGLEKDLSSEETSASTRLIVLSGSILFSVASTGYSAKLTSIHAIHQFIPEIKNMDDLAKNSHWEMGILNGSWDRWLLQNSPQNSSMDRIWKEKIQKKTSNVFKQPIKGLLKVGQNQKYAFLGDSLECRLILARIKVGVIEDSWEKNQSKENQLDASVQGDEMLPREVACKIEELPGDILKIGSSFGLQKYSPIKDIFNYHLIKLWSTGILQNLRKQFVEPHGEACASSSVFQPASMGDTFFSLIFFGIGVLISLFILVMELAFTKLKIEKKLHKSKRQNKKIIPYQE